MEDSIFIIFIAFGCLWIIIAAVTVIALFKSDERQETHFDKWGLLVALSIVIPIVITLVYGAVRY